MATKAEAQTVQTEEKEAQVNEGIVVADEALLDLSRQREKLDAQIAKLNDEKATINSLIREHLKSKDAIEIVDAKGNRLWYLGKAYTPKFDLDAMLAKYPILVPAVRKFTKTSVVTKLHFTKPKE